VLENSRFKIIPALSGQKNKTACGAVKTRESPYFKHFHGCRMYKGGIKVISGISGTRLILMQTGIRILLQQRSK